VLCFVYILTRLFIQIIQFILMGLIVAKSLITSPIQEALTNALTITENHNGRAAMHQLFTSTQKKATFQAVNNIKTIFVMGIPLIRYISFSCFSIKFFVVICRNLFGAVKVLVGASFCVHGYHPLCICSNFPMVVP